MQLIITEKPSVARDIAKILQANTKKQSYFEGKDLRVTWCFGHMCELQMPEQYKPEWKRWDMNSLPIIPDEFLLHVKTTVKDHWKHIEQLLSDPKITNVINACDAGREGELIFRYVYQLAKCTKPTQRLWVSSLTDEAILDGWKNLRKGSDFDMLADAARCRSEADWLVGLNATRAMTCLAQSAGGDQFLSIGRVQTPTLALIVQRNHDIQNFVPETFWRVQGEFAFTQNEKEIKWDGVFFQKNIKENKENKSDDDNKNKEPSTAERLDTQDVAQSIADAVKNQQGVVSQATKKRSTENPPLLYDLNTLQQRANQKYGLSAQETLNIAQALYETHKLLTYPRTDSQYLTPDQQATIPTILKGLHHLDPYKSCVEQIQAKPLRDGKRIFNAKEVGDHHAILPTGKNALHCKLSKEEKQVFDLVARRTLAAFSDDALFDLTDLVVDVTPKEGHTIPKQIKTPLQFRSKGKVCVQIGWQEIDPPSTQKDTLLPLLNKGDTPNTVDAKTLEGKTRPPPQYTEASLLGAMEKAGRNLEDEELKRAMRNAGLGTPATRAGIIETLIKRNFITRDKRNLLPTDRGISLVESVPVEELKSALLTGQWEARMANIAEGTETRTKFMDDVIQNLHDIVQQIKTSTPPTPEVIVQDDAKSLGNCPICGAPVRQQGPVFRCDTGRNCPFVVFGKMANRTISPTMIKDLLKTGTTQSVKGFKSQKTGKEFSAALRLDPNNKVVFDFSASDNASHSKTDSGSKTELASQTEPSSKTEKTPSPTKKTNTANTTPKTNTTTKANNATKAQSTDKTPKPSPSALPESIHPVGLSCPTCHQGTLIRGRSAWGCNRFREGCRFVFAFEQNGQLLSNEEATKQIQAL